MAVVGTGDVVGKVSFRIDKKSWDNLSLFQKKMGAIKRQMSGLNATIRVRGIVNQIAGVTKATTNGYRQIEKAKAKAGGYGLDMGRAKGSNREYASWWKDSLKQRDAEKRDVIASAKSNLSKKKGIDNAHSQALREDARRTNDIQKRRKDIQERWNNRNKTREVRSRKSMESSHREALREDSRRFKERSRLSDKERHIQFRQNGMQFSLRQRIGNEGLRENSLKTAGGRFDNHAASYRAGTISAREFNQAVSQTTQSQIRNARQTMQNSSSMRSLRTDLVAATAAYGAFSIGANIFNTGKEFDSMEAGMLLFAGNEAGVKETMSFLSHESERLGINLQEAARNYTKFAIVSRNKLTQTETRDLFSGFSEYATVMQVDQHRFGRGMMAIQQIDGLPI